MIAGQAACYLLTAPGWLSLLEQNRFAVEPQYWPRALGITGVSLMQSVWQMRWRAREKRLYHDAIAGTKITRAPVFILGHWRSGTTHLHNLLSLDAEQFCCPNTFQVSFPDAFLCMEDVYRDRFERIMPNTRGTDNVAFNLQAPQEDEFALCLLTLHSILVTFLFPRHYDQALSYLTFRDADVHIVEQWKKEFTWFLKKVTLKYNRTLLLKSPPHTARIKMLLEIFPDARFIHVHRHPYEVFRSFQRLMTSDVWGSCLQRPDMKSIPERILKQYTILYDAFFEERDLIPQGQFYEVAFEALEHDPEGQLRGIYNSIGLGSFEPVVPQVRSYIASIADYKKNSHTPLTTEWQERVAVTWSRSFEEWGYSTEYSFPV
jgi:hypothetical protein